MNGNHFLYNPHEQAKEDLLERFVVRNNTFDRLFNEIAESKMRTPEQHYLIEGQRGMGKTTFLLRIAYEIENDARLSEWLIPVLLKEEAYYGINKLFRLWEEVAKYLDHCDDAAKLFVQMECAYSEGINYERVCFNILKQYFAAAKKKIIILIDNINEILDVFTEMEGHRFREVLLTCADIRFIGASSVPLEPFYNYKQSFFDFFKLISLNGLTKAETQTLLLELGRVYGQETKVRGLLDEHPERVESIRILTGGVIRTMVLLFDMFVSDESAGSFKLLDSIVDKVTPLYKHRIEDLTPAQREVINVIALNWDAMHSEEIALKMRTPLSDVQKVLAQLEGLFVVESIVENGAKKYYQIKERFFNIWYLMRLAPKGDANKIVWLVRFLNTYYSRKEISQQAIAFSKLIDQGLYNSTEIYFRAEIFRATEKLGIDLEHELISKARGVLTEKDLSMAKLLSQSDQDRLQIAEKLWQDGKSSEAIAFLKSSGKRSNHLLGRMFFNVGDYLRAVKYYGLSVKEDKNYAYSWNGMAVSYHYLNETEKEVECYLEAIQSDPSFVTSYCNLGLSKQAVGDHVSSLSWYLKAVEQDDTSKDGWMGLGNAYGMLNQHENALDAYQKYLTLDAETPELCYNMGIAHFSLRRFGSAAQALEKAVVLENENAEYYYLLANIYLELNRFAEATVYFEKAAALAPSKYRFSQARTNVFRIRHLMQHLQYKEVQELVLSLIQPMTIRLSTPFERVYDGSMVSLLSSETLALERAKLPFYNEHFLYKIISAKDEFRTLGYVLGGTANCYPLDSTNIPMYSIGESDLVITSETVFEYLVFFFDVVFGKHGKFHLLRRIDDIPWDDTVEVGPQTLAIVYQKVKSPAILDETEEQFIIKHYMTFKDSLFSAEIVVNRLDGQVSMQNEILEVGELPIKEVDYGVKSEYLKEILEKDKDHKADFETLVKIGAIYNKNLLDSQKAIGYYQRALIIDATKANVWCELAFIYCVCDNLADAEICFKRAHELGDERAAQLLTWMCLDKVWQKEAAIIYAKATLQIQRSFEAVNAASCVLLWNDFTDEAAVLAREFLFDLEFIQREGKNVIKFLMLATAKKQYTFLLDYFNTPNFPTRDIFKPFYYALMKITNSEEQYRMPTELQTTCNDLVKSIEEFSIIYA